MAKLKLTETVLCGAQRALMSSKMLLEDILPGLSVLDAAGYYSCEVLDRSSYLSALDYLNEDPWQRLRTIAKNMPNTKLQMSFAGRYLLGERPFSDDVVEFFIQSAAYNGIKIMRIFDPLNDINHLTEPINFARKEGVHVQVAIIYNKSSADSNTVLLSYARKLEDSGADSICIIDCSELLTPYSIYNLIAAIKQEVSIPVQFSTPNNTGLAYMNTLKAVEAGLDMLDVAISPFAQGASYPATESLVTAFNATPYDSDMDINKLHKVEGFFSTLKEKYVADGVFSPSKLNINPFAMKNKIPDEAINYIFAKIADGAPDDMVGMLAEMEKLRALAGNPPLVFPIYIGIIDQAILNMQSDEPFSKMSEEFSNILKGKYGNTPDSIDPVFRENLVKKDEIYSSKFISPELESFRAELPQKFNEQPEDVLTLAQFPAIAPRYFETRSNRLYDIDGEHSDKLKQVHPI